MFTKCKKKSSFKISFTSELTHFCLALLHPSLCHDCRVHAKGQPLHRGIVAYLYPSSSAASVPELLAPGLNLPTEPNQRGAECLVQSLLRLIFQTFLVLVDYNWNEAEA